ncbi:legumain-like [Rhopalosiphum maidis]|uniref:legumain-like n=1 Tax=Rhopalosiphum maidis TaxID=43146 RepID=UPI000EFEA217|nr:legumain-like [Rhopalosiphum maidis]
MGVFHLIALALFAVGSFAEHNIPELTNEDNFIGGKKWIVLVAGSEGWNNYRHQADICHAYQIIKSNGIPEENIITMMVDDIAYNSRNPTPGKIINKPNGTDVYQGVVIDYKGKDVNKSNFLKIITGDSEGMRSIGTGKVVKGGRFDKIFINYVDHGSTGLLCFPNDYLYADELNDAFNSMYGNGNYNKMLLYIEACKAGSMFDGILSEDTNILAITASGPRESSYGCYCRSESGPYRTCLGDLFSVTWMEDLDVPTCKQTARKRSIFNDFREVRTNVTKSNVMMYGDFDTGSDKLSSFIGYHGNDGYVSPTVQKSNEINIKTTTSSRDVYGSEVQYQLAHDKLSLPETLKLSAELRKNNKMRSVIDSVFQNIYSEVVKARPDIKSKIGDYDEPNYLQLNLSMFPCYRNVLNQITESCFSLPQNPYVLDKLTIFANLCVVDNQIHQMVGNIVVKSCLDIPKNIINVQ